MTHTYLQHQEGHERRTLPGRFPALPADHALVGTMCCVCADPLQASDIPTLFAVGPDSPDDASAAADGSWYNALAVVGHERCLWPPDGTVVESRRF